MRQPTATVEGTIKHRQAGGPFSRLSAATQHVLSPATTRILLVSFLVLLLVQTTLAIVAYQYLGISSTAGRGLLLVKDAFAAALLVGLAVAYLPRLRVRWFDWLALGYVVVVLAYALVPLAIGTDLPLIAVAASIRQFVMPVEIYAIGRLAVAGGVDPTAIVRPFLVATMVAAAFTVGMYVVVPIEFWSSTLDLVTFEREVQGLPRAISLWDIGLLGQYGISDTGSFARAVGPFTHPVGTANYFAVPLLLLVAAALARVGTIGRGWMLALAIVLVAAAVITPISRGAWMAVVVAVILVAFLYRRPVPALVGLVAAGAFIVLVPPFSYSVESALSGTDSSVRGHQQAIEHGVDTAIDNPWGMGVGQGDHFGQALSTEGGAAGQSAAAGVGENLYLAMFVSVGPVGLALFLAWVTGIGLSLWPGLRASPPSWARVATGALLAGFLVASVSSSPLLRFTTSASFWLLCGLMVPNVAARVLDDVRGVARLDDRHG